LVPTAREGTSPTQRSHAKGAEDQADEPAEHADQRARHHRGAHVERVAVGVRPRLCLAPQQVDAEVEQRRADHEQQGGVGDGARDQAADHGARHRGRRHPGEQPPVDPARADVRDRRGEGGDPRDADVRAGAGGGGGGDQQDGRQADVAEHEAERAAGAGDDEAPDAEGGELHRSGSLAGRRDVNGTPV
jgi:hypothetical protein